MPKVLEIKVKCIQLSKRLLHHYWALQQALYCIPLLAWKVLKLSWAWN